jgi:hypothetical protein
MRFFLPWVAVVLAACSPTLAEPGFVGRPITTNAFGPTGYTLHKDEFSIGLGPIAFGITEDVQIGTNLLFWAFQVYNAELKAAVTKSENGAFAVGLQVYNLSLELEDADDDGKEFDFLALAPSLSISRRLSGNTMGHLGGQFAYFNAEADADIEDAEASGSTTGTSFFAGFEHSRSNRTKFLVDVGYDTTFEGARISGAVLFGWEKFRLKLGLSYFTAGDGFTFPIVGLWWRFKA